MKRQRKCASLHDEVMMRLGVAYEEMRDVVQVSPTTLALRVLDFYRAHDADTLETHIEYLSLEHLKQLARGLLSGRCQWESHVERIVLEQGDAFADLLQERYPVPIRKGDEPQYKLLANLSVAELDWNIGHIEKCGQAFLRHADALRGYRDEKAATDAATEQ